jgi:iron complex outermembrane receptor protein
VAAYAGDYEGVQYDFSAPYYNLNPDGSISTQGTRTTEDTINAPEKGKVHGVEADAMLAVTEGLTLSASYTYAYVRMPDALNPFPTYVPGTGMVYQTVAQTRHQVYTPEHSATAAVDYETMFENYTLRFHLDGNWNNGYYTSGGDVALAGGVFREQLQTQAAIVVNGRVSVADIPLASSGGTLTLSFWVRNLFDEEHLTTRSLSVTGGVTGAFNDPRTFGVQASARF